MSDPEAEPSRHGIDFSYTRRRGPDVNEDKFQLRIDGRCVVALGGFGLAAYYFSSHENKAKVVAALSSVLVRVGTNIGNITSGSLVVELYCSSSKHFLRFWDDYQSGSVKKRLSEEFSKIGIEKVTVEIENKEEVRRKTEMIRNPSLQLMIPDPQKEQYKQLKEIQEGMEYFKINTIDNLPRPIKSGIEDLFKKNDDKNGWRMLVYRLGLTSAFIEEMEENPPKHPCRKLFEETNDVKVNTLIQELYQMERSDVLDFIHAEMSKLIPQKSQSEKQQEFKPSNTFRSQKTTPESTSSVSDGQNIFIPQSQEELPVFDFSTTSTENVNVTVSPSSFNVETQTTRNSLQLVIPDPQNEEYKKLMEIQKGMEYLKYNTINDLPWPIKSGIEDSFKKKKDDKNDWRMLAYKLGLTSAFIEEMEENPPKHPCRKVFEEKNNVKVNTLIQVLYQMEKWDVLDFIYREMSKLIPQSEKQQELLSSNKRPSQESTPESSSSVSDGQNIFIPQSQETTPKSPRTPLTPKSPGTPRTPKSPGTPKSAGSEQLKEDNTLDSRKGSSGNGSDGQNIFIPQSQDDHKTKLDFHDKDSKSFWESIPPNAHSTRKEWNKFEETLKGHFPKVCQQSQLLRLICYILKVEYDQRHTNFVSDQDFANMIAWFGPLKVDGCLDKMSTLIDKSVLRKTSTGGHSFFAGYMSKDDSNKAVMAEEIGTFLIRFSTTYAKEGTFVLVLKTESGPEHHIIEKQGNGLTFEKKTYSDLIQLHREGLRIGGVSEDKRTSCRRTCSNLPLNTMFNSYKS